MPNSSSPGGRSKVGLPLAGVLQALSATPKLRAFSLTCRAMACTRSRGMPSSAAAPAIFSTNRVAPVPRRPAVYRLSVTATSSLTSTFATWMPSSSASSAAMSKLRTSPV